MKQAILSCIVLNALNTLNNTLMKYVQNILTFKFVLLLKITDYVEFLHKFSNVKLDLLDRILTKLRVCYGWHAGKSTTSEPIQFSMYTV